MYKTAATSYYDKHKLAAQAAATRSKELATNRLADPNTGPKSITRALATQIPQPLVCIKRKRPGPNGEPVGTYSTDPTEIDEEGRHQWGKIYGGNFKDEKKAVKYLMANYHDVIYRAKEATVSRIICPQLKAACPRGLDSVGGMDHWQPSETF